MDSHHVGRGRGGAARALQRIKAGVLVIGLQSDILFPLAEQQFLAQNIPGAAFAKIDSIYGHDGFLLEFDSITAEVTAFFKNRPATAFQVGEPPQWQTVRSTS
jgi:homoserine O-acetyltransferase